MINPLTFFNPRTVALAALSAVLILGTYYVKRQWDRGQAAIVEASRLRAEVSALVESARLTGAVMAQAEDRVATVVRERERVRTVYREAVRTDPTCAEWARQPIACPVGP